MKKTTMPGWELGIYTITPDDAKSALAAMTEDQRTSSEASIRNLVGEMTAGNFGISNDAWVKTQSGIFLNGKHRAEAIVRAGIEAQIIVLTVPDEDANKILRIMDCGVTRSISNVAQMLCGVRYSGPVAAVAKLALAYDRNLITCRGCYASTNRTDQGKFVSRDEVLDFISANSSMLEKSAEIAKRLNGEFGLMGVTGPAFIHFLISRKHSIKMATAFLEVLFSGSGEHSECIAPLRKATQKNLKSLAKVPSTIVTASIAKAFKLWLNGDITRNGFVSKDEPFPRI